MSRIVTFTILAALFFGAASWGLGREAAYYHSEGRV